MPVVLPDLNRLLSGKLTVPMTDPSAGTVIGSSTEDIEARFRDLSWGINATLPTTDGVTVTAGLEPANKGDDVVGRRDQAIRNFDAFLNVFDLVESLGGGVC